jgi:hypothetical protein
MELLGLAAVLLVLYVLAALAAMFGIVSRDGEDWSRH